MDLHPPGLACTIASLCCCHPIHIFVVLCQQLLSWSKLNKNSHQCSSSMVSSRNFYCRKKSLRLLAVLNMKSLSFLSSTLRVPQFPSQQWQEQQWRTATAVVPNKWCHGWPKLLMWHAYNLIRHATPTATFWTMMLMTPWQGTAMMIHHHHHLSVMITAHPQLLTTTTMTTCKQQHCHSHNNGWWVLEPSTCT